jgi:hypothetical protein
MRPPPARRIHRTSRLAHQVPGISANNREYAGTKQGVEGAHPSSAQPASSRRLVWKYQARLRWQRRHHAAFQHQPGAAGRRPDQAPQYMAHFRGRQGKQRNGRGGVTVTWRDHTGKRLDTDGGKVGLRQHDQRDVAIPAKARCALRSGPGLNLCRFQSLPQCASVPRRPAPSAAKWWQLSQRRSNRSSPARRTGSAAATANADHRPATGARSARRPEAPEAGAFSALTHGEPLPVLLAQQENLDFRNGHAPGAAIRGHDADRLVTGHSEVAA